MIFDSSSASHLKPWLVRALEPICDAEPGALADYILALLKHNVPENEMRKELAVQLDEFLENECNSFIDTLFTVLRTKSYLPYSANPPTPPAASQSLDNGIPIPLDALLTPSTNQSSDRTRKRSSSDDERDGRPVKGPRLSSDGEFSRYGNGRPDGRSIGGWSGRPERHPINSYNDVRMDGYGMPMTGGMGMGMNGVGLMNGRRPQQAYQPPGQKRGICRDYHNNGFCARGDMCKFSHGEDAVMPSQLYPMNMPPIPLEYIYNMLGVNAAAYDPNEARMDMRPAARHHQRAPLLPRVQQEDGSRVLHPVNASGELPVIQDLTPNIIPNAVQMQTEPIPQPQSHQPPSLEQNPPIPKMPTGNDYTGGAYNNMNPNMNGMQSYNNVPGNTEMAAPLSGPGSRPTRGNFRGRGGASGVGRVKGSFGAEVQSFRPERRNDKTLVVEKIPDEQLSLEQVNAWFKKFGTVTNVAIDPMGAKALVSFANHDDAVTAWKSKDAVFNNRFVKVYWHHPMEGHGQVGQRALAASASAVANISAKEHTPSPEGPSPAASVSTSTPKKAPSVSSAASALAAKQELLEKQITEQKALMASLLTATPDQKKEIMAKLRKLGEAMKSDSPAPTASSSATDGIRKTIDHEQKEREKLDKELEMHVVNPESEETAEDLKAKLERLKAEAASLGIADNGSDTSYGGYRGFRGRGRSRGFYRGGPIRGGPPRASMKLDNRPKKFLLKGVKEDGSQAVRDWYETTGQLESVEPIEGGGMLVSFKSRSAAEQGLAKGHSIPTIGAVQITWYTSKQNASATTPAFTSKSRNAITILVPDDKILEARRAPSPEQEEEIIASGWGGGEDDGDGMGML